MLQQTVVATVIPYFCKFLMAYPRIQDLAAANVEDVCGLWAGLGYYARARNLHKCAQAVAARGGVFPASVEALMELPGIGPYTARAVGAIAFGLPVLPVDGNIERVTARIFALAAPKAALGARAADLFHDPAAHAAPGDYAQALFDLGATVCTPKSPDCPACPWRPHCAAHAQGIAASLPQKSRKPGKPHRTGTVYALLDDSGDVLLLRRPPHGLLGGMLALPESPPAAAAWSDAGTVDHIFTHFTLTLSVQAARVPALPENALRHAAATAALPSVMRKALDAARRALNSLSHD